MPVTVGQRGFSWKYIYYKSKSINNKSEKFDWAAEPMNLLCRKSVFTKWKQLRLTTVQKCNGTAYIVGEGQLTFNLGKPTSMIMCKHALDFNENVISFSSFIRSCNVNFVPTEKIERCNINSENGERLHTIQNTNGLYRFSSARKAAKH